MSSKNDKIVVNHELFKDAMRGITTLKNKKKVDLQAYKKNRQPKKTIIALETFADTNAKINEDITIAAVTSGQNLFFTNSDVRIKTIRQLKKGTFKIEKILDLHGETTNAARILLNEFLYNAQKENLKLVLVIHGKGVLTCNDEPKIKNMVNRILQNHQTVLAFCSSTPKHGGAGAVYVLLKNLGSK